MPKIINTQFSPSVTLSGTVIDWSQGNVFTTSISSNQTFTFSNDTDGRTIVIKITNGTAGAFTLTWPSSVQGAYTSLTASKTAIVTLIKIGNLVYSSSLEF